MNLTLLIVVALSVLFAVAVLTIPATTRTTVEVYFDAPIEAVWDVYTDFASQSNWRSDVASVDMIDGQDQWIERLEKSGMDIHFQVLEKTQPHKLVLKINAEGRFAGQSVAEFRQQDNGTIGMFTEEVTSLGVLAKVLRYLFFNPKKFIEEYAVEAKSEIKRRMP